MSRRIDVELTSDRGDGIWTWRAAGAKQPKGEVDAGLLPDGASTGDVLTAEADFDIDGITIVSVAPPKRAKRSEPELLEILGSGKEEAAVTTTWVERKGGGKGRDKGRGGGRGRGRDGDDRGGRGGGGRGGGGGGRGQQRSHTPAPPERPKKPKAPRLRPKRTHRDAALAALTEAERPVAEQALKGGIPAVRDALRAQNEENKKAGRPIVAADELLGLAERLLPKLKTAEWHDRAEAAVAQMETVDLRDLRSVVTASDGAARDDATRALAEQLRTGLVARVESDHGAWLAELAETLADGRVARTLNLSSRPPKAGAPLPVDMAERLAAAASEGLTAEVGQKRWQTVLESVARSPVRQSVVPEGIPANPNDELLETVRNLSMQVPQIAALFGIEPQKPSRKRRSRKGSGTAAKGGPSTGETKAEEPASAPRIPPPPTLPSPAEQGATPAEAGDQASSDAADATAAAVPAVAEDPPAPDAPDPSDASDEVATPDPSDDVGESTAEAPVASDGGEQTDDAAEAETATADAVSDGDVSTGAVPDAEPVDDDAAVVADEEE